MGAAKRALNQKLERIGALAQHAADEIAATIRAGYQRSQREIAELQSRLATLREETIAEIREDVGKLTATLDRLNERATRELQEIKAEANFKIAELQAGLRLSVEVAKAHFKMIEAKRDLVLARLAILRKDLVEAEIRVESAAKKIDEARSPAPFSGFRLSRPNVQLGGSLAGKLSARASSIISSESFSSLESLPIVLLHFVGLRRRAPNRTTL